MTTTEYDAIVVGGGFSGIYTTYQLRKLGYSIKGFENGSEFGGTWYWNKYPGARVDSEVPVYQLWMEEVWKDWNYSVRFPDWKEIAEYFRHADNVLKISQHFTFNTYVSACHYDDKTNKWTVTTTGEGAGTYTCTHLILNIGFAAKKYIPNFKGLDKYKGIMHHTCEWPGETVDFKGKRVAVVGTGASGVQVIQETGPVVEHMTVYQRTPNLALPMRQRPLTIEEQENAKKDYPALFKKTLTSACSGGFPIGFKMESAVTADPEEREKVFRELWNAGGFAFWIGTYYDVWSDWKANNLAYDFWRKETLKRINNPDLHEKLAPKVAPVSFAGKRPSLEQRYYEIYNQDNVDLLDIKNDPIAEFTEKGIKLASGDEREFDIIVLATGYDTATGPFLRMDIRGANGLTIAEKWANGTRSYLGMMIGGFPNLYFTYGPQAATAYSNGPTSVQIQCQWVVNNIEYLKKNNIKSIHPKSEAEEEWATFLTDTLKQSTAWGVKSWYTGANIPGKRIEALNFIGGVPVYKDIIDKEEAEKYPHFITA